MIGVAVGSPSQLQPTNPGSIGQSPLAKMEMELLNSNDHYFEDPTNKNKGARWKKIGGLFKAKNAFVNEPAPSPFYQLQAQYAAKVANQSESSFHSRSIDPTPHEQDARFLFDKILGSNGQLDPQKYEESSAQPMAGIRSGTDKLSNPSDYTPTQRQPRQKIAPPGLSLLDVKIPDVQMERYSVMFGSLLDKQDSPNLLSRRDRELKKLLTISDESEESSEVARAQAQQPERFDNPSVNSDPSYLAPDVQNAYPRRATSPTPSKSPSFSLFPQLPQAPEKIVGPILPGKQSPLQRSFTAPARLSPRQEAFDLDVVHPPHPGNLVTEYRAVASPPATASTSDLKRDSSTFLIQSPTSTRSSVNEDALLDIQSVGESVRTQDQSDILDDQELKVAPLKPRHSSRELSPGPLTNQNIEKDIKKANRIDINEDTLAALERPRSITSKSKDSSVSMKPSKARIDQIMRGPTLNQLSTTSDNADGGQIVLENPRAYNNKEMPPKPVSEGTLRTGLESRTRGLETSIPAITAIPTNEQNPIVMSHGQGASSVTSRARSKNDREPQPKQLSTIPSEQPPRGTGPFGSLEGQRPDSGQNSAREAPNGPDFRERQLAVTGKRRPSQPSNEQAQSRPPVANTSHRLHPAANAPNPARLPLNAPNRSFPIYRPPPQDFRTAQQATLIPNTAPIATTEKDQDNILDYYLDDTETSSSSQPPKPPKKLQKRPSDKSKRRLSLSNKPLPYPKSQSKASPPSKAAPRSPVPISKYSPNASAIQKSLVSPPITSCIQAHQHSQSHSSIFSDYSSTDPRLLSPAVRAARSKAAEIIKATSVEDLALIHTRSGSKSSPPRRPPRAEFSFIVDTPNVVASRNETSFYAHSNASTPSITNTNTPTSRSQSPSDGLGLRFIQQQQQQVRKPPLPRRSPSRGTSMSNLPHGAGGVDSGSSTQRFVPPVRSASAGTVGAGPPGIQGHLKPERGEKVVERQAGLVPTIVDFKQGHHAGKSVNLVIESI
jgi:hypothetical protein